MILEPDAIVVMYQTFDSVAADLPALAESTPHNGSVLFITVDGMAGACNRPSAGGFSNV